MIIREPRGGCGQLKLNGSPLESDKCESGGSRRLLPHQAFDVKRHSLRAARVALELIADSRLGIAFEQLFPKLSRIQFRLCSILARLDFEADSCAQVLRQQMDCFFGRVRPNAPSRGWQKGKPVALRKQNING